MNADKILACPSMNFLIRWILSLVLVSLSPILEPNGLQAREHREFHTTSRGLELNNVHFHLVTQHEFYEQLYARAVDRFRQRGVSLETNGYVPGDILLTLTVDPAPIVGCEDRYLYTLQLEIGERVVTERTPQQRTWSITYQLGEKPWIVRGARVEMEILEKDLDELIDEFLVEYEHANSGKQHLRPLPVQPVPLNPKTKKPYQ